MIQIRKELFYYQILIDLISKFLIIDRTFLIFESLSNIIQFSIQDHVYSLEPSKLEYHGTSAKIGLYRSNQVFRNP
jgi:hypothetical protein